MKKKYAEYLLEKTRRDYNLIADEFSKTRSFAWPEFLFFEKQAESGDMILDLGCGNGRLFEIFKNKEIDYIGADNSEELIKIAKNKYPEAKFQVADAFQLPFPDGYFDKIFNVAVLHHIPSKELRLLLLREANRVLRPGGQLVLSVWHLWRGRGLKLIIKFFILKILGKSKLDFQDILVPWQKTVNRYVHCFTKRELKALLEGAGFEVIEAGILRRQKSKNRNIYIIARKLA